MLRSARAFERLAWLVLAYGIAVILWGAVVRATGSGAGCGAHWPLCNGEVVPPAPALQTLIEFGHRATSGLILILTAVLVGAAWRTYPAGHVARRAAAWSMVFVLIEAAVGAGIVLLRLVEHNASALRAGYVAVHLANTLLLVGMYVWAVFAAQPRPVASGAAVVARLAPWLKGALAGMLLVSAAGAVVALGDTLFPTASLRAGLAADFDPTSHFLIRLRIWHPLLAAALSLYMLTALVRGDAVDQPAVRWPARLAIGLILGQIALGVINLLARAPLSLQMAHLLVSNLLWVALVWMWLHARVAAGGNVRS
jgi:cytochrome c oxidase assembly protein subunit 15